MFIERFRKGDRKVGKSYLVTGARLRCIWGSKPGTLVITQGHNCVADGRKKANCSDSRKEENIPDFGTCGISACGKTCKECMSLASRWENTGGSSWKLEKLNGDTALTMDSILLCRRGGIIVPETSGQGDVREIDWKQLMARYPMLGFAAAVGKMGCSVFGFDPVNFNTGNFIYEKEDLIIHGITRLSFRATYNSMEEYRGGSLGKAGTTIMRYRLRTTGRGWPRSISATGASCRTGKASETSTHRCQKAQD